MAAEWIVTGKAGEVITLQVQEFVLKCDDGWYVDYVLLPAAVDSGSESGADDTDTSSESGVGDLDCTEGELEDESGNADETVTETITEDGNMG